METRIQSVCYRSKLPKYSGRANNSIKTNETCHLYVFFFSFFLSFFFFFLLCCTCRIVIPEPGVKPVSPVVEVRSFSYPLDCQASPLIDCFEASFHFKALLYTENRKISQVHSWDLHFCCISISVVKKMNPLYKGVTK